MQKLGNDALFEVNGEAKYLLTAVLHRNGIDLCGIVKRKPHHRGTGIKSTKVGECQSRKCLIHRHTLLIEQHDRRLKIGSELFFIVFGYQKMRIKFRKELM